MKRRGILKRKTRLRPVSRQMRAKRVAAEPVRSEYRSLFPKCQRCRKEWATDIHEITRGKYRSAAIGVRACLLSVCRRCHDEIQCWPLARQLALKRSVDPAGYDLEEVRRVIRGSSGRAAVVVTETDVDQEWNEFRKGA